MLRELRNVRQVAGEDRRRWFFCHDLDLVVWEDEGGTITGFQLAYDRHRNEHSLSWRHDRGISHYAVDDGEPRAGVDATPFMYADGPFDRDRVLGLFLGASSEVPATIVVFVEARLQAFDGPLAL